MTAEERTAALEARVAELEQVDLMRVLMIGNIIERLCRHIPEAFADLGPQPPTLTLIDGGKPDDNGPAAA
jgi:hypothetical protein